MKWQPLSILCILFLSSMISGCAKTEPTGPEFRFSNDINGKQHLLTFSSQAITISRLKDQFTFTIKNSGHIAVRWYAELNKPILTLDVDNGSILPQRSVPVTIKAQRTGLGTGKHVAELHITTDHSQSESIVVTLIVGKKNKSRF